MQQQFNTVISTVLHTVTVISIVRSWSYILFENKYIYLHNRSYLFIRELTLLWFFNLNFVYFFFTHFLFLHIYTEIRKHVSLFIKETKKRCSRTMGVSRFNLSLGCHLSLTLSVAPWQVSAAAPHCHEFTTRLTIPWSLWNAGENYIQKMDYNFWNGVNFLSDSQEKFWSASAKIIQNLIKYRYLLIGNIKSK